MTDCEFADRDALAAALAAELAEAVRDGGTLALSGGTTPARMLAALGRCDLPWERIVALPVDERWVDEGSPRSNARMIRAALPSARLISLYTGGPEPVADERVLAGIPWPPAALVLGMGDDGHTASWFPGGDRLAEALVTPDRLISMRAPGAGEPRITLTLSAVLQAQRLYLHVEGAHKRAVLARALGPGPEEELPIRAVLRRAPGLRMFYAP